MKRSRITATIAALATIAGLSLGGAAAVAQPAGALVSTTTATAYLPVLYCATHSLTATVSQADWGVSQGLPVTKVALSGQCATFNGKYTFQYRDKNTKAVYSPWQEQSAGPNGNYAYSIPFAGLPTGALVCVVVIDETSNASASTC
jgi:hypothetical protein